VGDVILVMADSLNPELQSERYSKVINSQVVSDQESSSAGAGLQLLTSKRGGSHHLWLLGALGVPLLGEGVLSTWGAGTVEEIVQQRPRPIIVYEGAEDKLINWGSGLLEELGIGGFPAGSKEERDRYRQSGGAIENQLASGQPTALRTAPHPAATSRAVAATREEELESSSWSGKRQEPLRNAVTRRGRKPTPTPRPWRASLTRPGTGTRPLANRDRGAT